MDEHRKKAKKILMEIRRLVGLWDAKAILNEGKVPILVALNKIENDLLAFVANELKVPAIPLRCAVRQYLDVVPDAKNQTLSDAVLAEIARVYELKEQDILSGVAAFATFHCAI
jgi:hypothetical protein